MRPRPWILLAVALAAPLAALAQQASAEAATAEEPSPALHVEAEEIDLGEVREGEQVEARFVLHNRGEGELFIYSAKPS